MDTKDTTTSVVEELEVPGFERESDAVAAGATCTTTCCCATAQCD